MTKKFTITDILTDAEIKAALNIYKSDRNNFHRRCLEEVIKPNMARINKNLGQENDPAYLAYAVEHVFNQAG